MPAFPCAEGHGTNATGGRSAAATVYVVTHTGDSGPGSLREACEASGPRIVTFTTGGLWQPASQIEITNPNITILGQTAPPDSGGVAIRGIAGANTNGNPGPVLYVKASNVIVRFVDFYQGYFNGVHIGRPNNAAHIDNIVFDHCGFAWAYDEATTLWWDTSDVTYSRCIFAKSIGWTGTTIQTDAAKGPITGADVGEIGPTRISYHHNAFIHLAMRNPNLGGNGGFADVTNNVMYNAKWSATKLIGKRGPFFANVIKNVYKAGPDHVSGLQEIIAWYGGICGAYADGNIGYPGHTTQESMMSTGIGDRRFLGDAKFGTPEVNPVTQEPASSVLASVSADVGNHTPTLSPYFSDLVVQMVNGSGTYANSIAGEGGFPAIAAGTAYAQTNGLSDTWSAANGNVNALDINGEGYTYIEQWSHELCGDCDVEDIDPPDPVDDCDEDTGIGLIERQVAVGANDGIVVSGGGYIPDLDDSIVANFVGDFANDEFDWTSFVIFDGIALDATKTIVSATLEMYSAGLNGASSAIQIEGSTNPAPPVSKAAFDAYGRTAANVQTTVTAAAAPLGTWVSFDVSAVISEMIATHTSGDDMMLIIGPQVAGWGGIQERWGFGAVDSNNGRGAKLTISYTYCTDEEPEDIIGIPARASRYADDSMGNVTLLTSHPRVIDLFGDTGQNLMGFAHLSYNRFTGYGEIYELCTEYILQFNIDTGIYEVVTCEGVQVYTGTSTILAQYGLKHPVKTALAPARGKDYFDAWQIQENATHGSAIETWPTRFDDQYDRAQELI